MTKKIVCLASVALPVLIAMVLLAAASSSVAANAQPSAATAGVKIDNFVFGPQTITVPVGTTVTWTNADDIPHTSVSTEGVFKSKVLDTDEKILLHLYQGGNLSLLLHDPPEDDRQSRGAVNADFQRAWGSALENNALSRQVHEYDYRLGTIRSEGSGRR